MRNSEEKMPRRREDEMRRRTARIVRSIAVIKQKLYIPNVLISRPFIKNKWFHEGKNSAYSSHPRPSVLRNNETVMPSVEGEHEYKMKLIVKNGEWCTRGICWAKDISRRK